MYARPTKYDVILHGKKIAGAAQRKKKQGYLHQGSICFTLPDYNFLKKVFLNEDILKAIFANSCPLVDEKEIIEKEMKRLKNIISKNFEIFLKN